MTLADQVLEELRPGLGPDVIAQLPNLSKRLALAKRILCYGVGREGLMMKALAMRLYHLGLDVHVVGDMTAPPVASEDVLIVSAGPGSFSTVEALVKVAQNAKAEVICVTAEPGGSVPQMADAVVRIPAQTMANDQSEATSVLPMGSLYEALMFLHFELLVLDLRDRLGIASDAMRANHTNME